MRPAPYGAFKRFCLWQKPCRRANSFRPRISICQGPQKSLLFWARAPTARAGVAGAGSVGVNGNCFHSFFLGREWFFKDLCRKGERVPPCRAGSFLNGQKGTKDPLGAASGEHLACGGAHSHCPQPPGDGNRSLWILSVFRRAKSRSVSLLFPAHWGLLPSKFNYSSSNVHRLVPANLLGAAVVAPDSCPTATVIPE